MANREKDCPVAEFRAGTIVASLWSPSAPQDPRFAPQPSIRIQKRYRDEKTGEWKTTAYFRPDDLPKLALVANKVFEHLCLKTSGDAIA